jgi:hypothetical protein
LTDAATRRRAAAHTPGLPARQAATLAFERTLAARLQLDDVLDQQIAARLEEKRMDQEAFFRQLEESKR